ncbi:hypothetical protein FisN_20Lh216 [Fistulifera solaris]|uniref:Purple acid phosphatase n=1 Tax=Fistulifera solaris TaxID=1519565 RepID=A0A1Z5KS29_FISSO|nr:hypothetical protein FisN_20Lh216 [Fistulifera solaris]|eukprot:GAX28905.1 hypothetical protein FisN_20Lh216 [Fistulifera solaris]
MILHRHVVDDDSKAETMKRPLLPTKRQSRHSLWRFITISCMVILSASLILYSLSENNSITAQCIPKYIHIAQRNNVNQLGRVSMTLSFAIDRHCDVMTPCIHYGRREDTEETVLVVQQLPLQFNYTSTNGTFYSDWWYHVELPTLMAGDEEYWYQIVTQKTTQHPPATFHTPPLPGQSTAFAVVGDWGQTEHSLRTMQKILRAIHTTPLSQLIVAGDMSYADSDPQRWLSWFELMEPLLGTLPTHVAVGNHEIECDTVTREVFVPYEHYFSNPNRVGEAYRHPLTPKYPDSLWQKSCSTPSEFLGYYVYGNSFYAYRHGLVHIIVLNSYTYSGVGSEQYLWLQEELQTRFDRTVTPWLMVVFHCPFYTTFDSHVDEVQSRTMKHAMEPLFVKYGVNFVLSGHDHAYLRSKSMKYGHVDSTQHAPIYFIVGAGGNREGHPHGYIQDYPEVWVAKRTMVDWGYGQWWFPNATHAHFTWIPDGFEGDDTGDDVWLVNPHVVSQQVSLS